MLEHMTVSTVAVMSIPLHRACLAGVPLASSAVFHDLD